MRSCLLTIALVCSCASAPAGNQTTAPQTSPAPAQQPPAAAAYPAGLTEVSAELAPVPFPPGALAASLPAGSSMVYRVEAAGQPPALMTTEFVEVDASGATMRSHTAGLDGTAQGEPKSGRASWTDLEAHAHFPRVATAIAEASVEVPAGTFAAYQYEITGDDASVTRLWFAKELPGPPVKVVREQGDQIVYQMVLVKDDRPAAGTQTPAAPSKHEAAQVACAQREEAVRSRGRFFSKITVDKDYSGEWVLARNRQVTAFLDIQDSRHPRSRAAEGGDAEAIHVLVVPNQPREHIAQTLGDPITQADLKAASAVFREAHALARRLGIRESNIYANSESRIGVGYLHVHIEGRLPAGKKLPRLSK